ncbi:MAG: S1 RNA-binding domain-containing protein [Anaerolineales bacterium]
MTDAGDDLKALLASDDRFASPERGDLLQGTVIAQDSHGLIVDLGQKRDGVVPQSDLDKIPKEDGQFPTGALISVMVIDPVDSDGNLLVSISQARESGDWLEARRVMENDELFNAEATSFNKGGLLVPFGNITGFIPSSHLSGLPRGLDEGERLNFFKNMIGKQIPLKIIEVDPQRRRLVLSERKAIRQWRQDQKADVIKALKEGEHRKGIVTSLREFGAFVDIGGADGLIHISELSWTRIEDPSAVLEIGQEVEALIIRLDTANNRIGLSLKRLEQNPWELAEDHIEAGQELEGEVTVLSAPGAFVLVGENLEGLLKTPNGPGDLTPGMKVKVRVVELNPERERLDLELVNQTS